MDVRFVKKLYADLHCKHIEEKDRDKDSPSTLQKKANATPELEEQGKKQFTLMSKGARDGRTFGTMITDDVQYTMHTILSYGRWADPVLIDFVEYVTELVGGAVEDIKKNKEEVKVNTERTKDKQRKMNDKIDDDKKNGENATNTSNPSSSSSCRGCEEKAQRIREFEHTMKMMSSTMTMAQFQIITAEKLLTEGLRKQLALEKK